MLAEVVMTAARYVPGRLIADLKIARGLDYYTGTVYETELVGFESWGRFLPAAATTRWPVMGGSPIPASACRSVSRGSWRRCSPRDCSVRLDQCPRQCWWPSTVRRPALRRSRSRSGSAPAGSRPRWRRGPRSSAVRSATPTGAASRSCGSAEPLAAKSRTSGQGNRCRPTRPCGCRALKT